MPKRPASKAQLRKVHAAKRRGEQWAKDTAKEWHGKTFKNLPERKGEKKRRSGKSRGKK